MKDLKCDIIYCDVCGKQILTNSQSEWTIGIPYVGGRIFLLDINTHACYHCYRDPLLKFQYDLDESDD
jgi:hypothetical protein